MDAAKYKPMTGRARPPHFNEGFKMANKIRVWDLPTRVFHWALVACVLGLVVTGKVGGAWIDWHARLGYAVLALLLFRLVWGLVGGRWSRFASFIYAPSSVINYLKGRAHPDHLIGHNPLGAGSVFAMLLVLLAQVGSGLVSDDEISFTGPLNRFVSSANGLLATWYHKQVGQWLMIGLCCTSRPSCSTSGGRKTTSSSPCSAATSRGRRHLRAMTPSRALWRR